MVLESLGFIDELKEEKSMVDIVVTKKLTARELVEAIMNSFDQEDVVTTGLWIRKVEPEERPEDDGGMY